MTWRLICDGCRRVHGGEIKSIGVIENPDLACAACGVPIREHTRDLTGTWFPVTQSDVDTIRARHA